MSTVQEIETAIRALSASEREHLLGDLPLLFPELAGESAWRRIIRDPRPRPALTALLDEVDAAVRQNPEAFPEVQESDFEVRP